MKIERTVMGMPAKVELVDVQDTDIIDAIFTLWEQLDERFSLYKETSEISQINRGERTVENYSEDMQTVFALAAETKAQTNGHFDIVRPDGVIDPSGIVKGWAIGRAAEQADAAGVVSYYIEIAGDIQTKGVDATGQPWRIGITNPFNDDEIIKVLYPHGAGVATSGTAQRGQHIYDPHHPDAPLSAMMSITVIGPNIYDADRFATAAFAMGEAGVYFIEALPGFEAYAVNRQTIATETSGFQTYLTQ